MPWDNVQIVLIAAVAHLTDYQLINYVLSKEVYEWWEVRECHDVLMMMYLMMTSDSEVAEVSAHMEASAGTIVKEKEWEVGTGEVKFHALARFRG